MKLKKILAAVVAIGAIACTSAFAASVSLTTESTTVEAGANVTVELNVAANPGVNYFQGDLTAEGLTMVSYTDAKLFAGSFCGAAKLPYCVSYQDDLATENNVANGKVGTFVFAVPADAVAGATYVINYVCDSENTMNVDYDGVDFGTATLTLTVKSAAPAFAYTLSDAAAGADVDGQATYYTTVKVNTPTAGARFQVANGGETKSWALPSICGSGSFVAIVGTNGATGTFANSIVVDGVAVSNVVNY